MPLYDFIDSKGKVESFFFESKDVPSFGAKIKIGRKNWIRTIIEAPHGVVDSVSKINPFNSRDFVEKTKNKKGNLGDLFDKSAELSEMRMEKYGGEHDPISEKHDNQKRETRNAKRAKNREAKAQRQSLQKLKDKNK